MSGRGPFPGRIEIITSKPETEQFVNKFMCRQNKQFLIWSYKWDPREIPLPHQLGGVTLTPLALVLCMQSMVWPTQKYQLHGVLNLDFCLQLAPKDTVNVCASGVQVDKGLK